ncbi:hypothetical protein C8R45DRAFT_1092123 [Mycena sanguinolenta]|nr:hypothetical protein C8R45DRAFT_1092123 [Mycena sanguinolenta]
MAPLVGTINTGIVSIVLGIPNTTLHIFNNLVLNASDTVLEQKYRFPAPFRPNDDPAMLLTSLFNANLLVLPWARFED